MTVFIVLIRSFYSPTSALFHAVITEANAQYKSLPFYAMGLYRNVVSVMQKLFLLTLLYLLYSAEHQPLAHLLALLVILFSKGNITGVISVANENCYFNG